MKRRDFLKATAPLALVPFFNNRLFAAPMSLSQQQAAMLMPVDNDKVLVVIQLNGGNDGYNTVLLLDQYSNLAAARPSLLIPDTSALPLGNFQTGLHPAMSALKTLYDEQRVCVVQGVGYPAPNFSHFRASDIYTTASDSNEVLNTGWLGRFLETYPNPAAYTAHPLGVKIGSDTTVGFQSSGGNLSQSVPKGFTGTLQQLQALYTNDYSGGGLPPNPLEEITWLQTQKSNANLYAGAIQAAWSAGMNTQTYPSSPAGTYNALGNQLQIVARLIKGGLKTRIYWVEAGGFDTHDGQVVAGATTTGIHANLLGELSNSIYAFQRDLQAMGLEDRVLGMTYSEFGRKIIANASVGTDHSTIGPMFIFGQFVNPTVLGSNPVIPAGANGNTHLPHQFDFRQIYASVMRAWFCLDDTETSNVLLHSAVPTDGVSTPCYTVAALPIELNQFEVENVEDKSARLWWTTLAESNSLRIDIERSTNGSDFRKIGSVPAKGHSHQLEEYEYEDKDLPLNKFKTFYYRLSFVDLDGSNAISPIRTAYFSSDGEDATLSVSPNPTTNGVLKLSFGGKLDKRHKVGISIVTALGRVVQQMDVDAETAEGNVIEFTFGDGSPSKGIYFVVCQNGANYFNEQVIVQ